MEIFLIRHGMTAGNKAKRYIGRTDEPLSSEGEALARESGCFPDVRRVFVTPLLRTQQTASILFPNAEQRIEPDLREMDFGKFENRSADEMSSDYAYRAWVDGSCLSPCPGGEGVAGFAERVRAAFTEAVREKQSPARAIFVLHGGTIMAIMDGFSAEKRGYYDWFSQNCRGWRAALSWDGGRPVLHDCESLKTLLL
ncbi:MAG: histidine phosphatase family protein [Clostridiaceae bacterium]|nr:histidine phosphatase family protein [Clostridiaceae bacterium]